MNWLTDFVKPKLQALVSPRREFPENLWHKCDKCSQMIFHRDFETALHVCNSCGHHHKISPKDRFNSLFDNGTWSEVPFQDPLVDPLKFKDTKKYPDRLKEARAKTNLKDSVLVGQGFICQNPAICAAHDFSFMGGSMGIGAGNALVAAAQEAVKKRAALIVFPAAGGARMQEGILSLMQMPRSTIAVELVKEAGLPYIVILTDPTTGGVTASYAMLGDIHLAEPNALICFTGPRVIEQTIKEKLPEGFQRSEYLLEHGMIDQIIHRHEMRESLGKILRVLLKKSPA
jgi:acetyl-CoA carboxylase carboxyl transferase subunit beta